MSKIEQAKQLILNTVPPGEYLSDFTFDVPFFSPHHLVAIQANYIYNFSVLWDLFKPQNYLVIGVLVGSAESYAMKRTKHIPNKIVICDIDLLDYNHGHERTCLASAYKNIGRYMGNNLLVIGRADSKQTDFMRKLGPYDLIFVDGEHTKKGVMNDLDHAIASLDTNGVIMVHDLELTSSSVPEGYREWVRKHPEMDHVEIPGTHFQLGIGLIQKRT